ncbi:Nucleic acid-binding [Babesia duncani]|uniref:Nucleic acid-binding n=1 Tax=Babesia duncani TaxID=323732 RepID=A0AAD9PNE1_9APIC|nr:Nucleic acid-binding [Babesia duncani]
MSADAWIAKKKRILMDFEDCAQEIIHANNPLLKFCEISYQIIMKSEDTALMHQESIRETLEASQALEIDNNVDAESSNKNALSFGGLFSFFGATPTVQENMDQRLASLQANESIPFETTESIQGIDKTSSIPYGDLEEDSRFQPGPICPALSSLSGDMELVDIYLVAVEMIRATIRDMVHQCDVLNYRGIDPSVETNCDTMSDYSIQIIASNEHKQYHIGFGDILRLKRVKVQHVCDKGGKTHFNILMDHKNRSSIRCWNYKDYKDPDDAPEEDKSIQALQALAKPIHQGEKTTLYKQDREAILKLQSWVKKELDPFKIVVKNDYRKSIVDVDDCSSDIIVCVVEKSPEPQIDLVVSDESGMAVVLGFSHILCSNLLNSHNQISPGEWIKIRSIRRNQTMFKRKDDTLWVALKCNNYTCVTRLPPCNLKYTTPSDKYKRPTFLQETQNLEEKNEIKNHSIRQNAWTANSKLNDEFPLKITRDIGYINSVLQNRPRKNTIQIISNESQPVPTSLVSSQEEGEIF